MTIEEARNALSQVIDPELGVGIVELNMVQNLSIDEAGKVSFDFILTSAACPLKETLKKMAHDVLIQAGATDTAIRMGSRKKEEHTGSSFIAPESFESIKNIIAVYSSKGGVGKTTLAVNLAAALAKTQKRVGLLDLDIYGASVPRMMGIYEELTSFGGKIVPPRRFDVDTMSIAFFLRDPNEPILWRAPLANGAIKQMFEDVIWDSIDYLVIDLPPGTGDIQLTIAQSIPITGTVFITTPQMVAVQETLKGIKMFQKMGIPVMGIVKNMSYFMCPHCGKKSEVFPQSELDSIALGIGSKVIGELPIDPLLAFGGDNGIPLIMDFPDSETSKAIASIAADIVRQTKAQDKDSGECANCGCN